MNRENKRRSYEKRVCDQKIEQKRKRKTCRKERMCIRIEYSDRAVAFIYKKYLDRLT